MPSATENARPIPVPRPRRHLTDRQRLAWLRLIRSENVGPVTFRELLNHFGGAEEALEVLPELSRRGGRGRPIQVYPLAATEQELERGTKTGARLTALDEPGYPPLLAVIEAPPPLIYIRGRSELLDRPVVAIVGARDASAAGRKITHQIGTALGNAGMVIASGLARGIDTAAHDAALATGTAAVLAGGIDVVYPPENAALHDRIASDGVLIAENAPGLSPRGRDFPRRNRLISGMSLAVLVVEAAMRSGSRITADFAKEQGRMIFAVPGNPLDLRAGGTNQLIKEGARLVTEAGDVIAGLGPLSIGARLLEAATASDDRAPLPPTAIAAADRSRIVEALGPAPIGFDDLLRMADVTASQLRVALIELELAGQVERLGGMRVALKV
jgi:DNA processing protein